MSFGEIAIRLAASLWFGWIPATLLFASGPPKHESRWYPDPDGWFYRIKLVIYTVLAVNYPSTPNRVGWWFVKGVAAILLSTMLAAFWLTSI